MTDVNFRHSSQYCKVSKKRCTKNYTKLKYFKILMDVINKRILHKNECGRI